MKASMKIITWNINSLRLRVPHFKAVLENIDADIICVQEMKCQNHEVPAEAMAEHGFINQYVRGEKGYNGVGIFSRMPLTEIEMLDFGGNSQSRHISALLPNGTRLHNFYVPAGGDEPDPEINPSFAHKLRFLDDMEAYFIGAPLPHRQIGLNGLAEQSSETFQASHGSESNEVSASIERAKPSRRKNDNNKISHILVGDLNIAPFEHDVWSHKQLLKVVSHTPIEVEKMMKIYATRGWVDVARHFVPYDQKCYSWWSYRNKDWEKSNRGRRLDHIWVTPDLKDKLVSHHVLQLARNWEKPSDHVPVMAEISID